jgi:hypothetical protein
VRGGLNKEFRFREFGAEGGLKAFETCVVAFGHQVEPALARIQNVAGGALGPVGAASAAWVRA